MSLEPLVKLDADKVMGSSKILPLKMSFWPRGRTLVEGRRRVLRSLMVESGEIEMGMETPLNLTFMVMVLVPLSLELASLASISQ